MAVTGGRRLQARDLRVPGDLSSAAFPAVAAAALRGSDVTIEGVGLNPSADRDPRPAPPLRRHRRRARLPSTAPASRSGPSASATAGSKRSTCCRRKCPTLIDELPVLAALATFGGGVSVSGAGELRVKESDRISALVGGLRAMGADADERPDGFTIRPTRPLTGGEVDAHGDHRLAMAFAIAALGATGPTSIDGADVVAVSYPGFFADLDAAARVKADKIYLVGFMGAGKSTVARALAKRLDWRVEDIDERIEARERRDIPSIFRQHG